MRSWPIPTLLAALLTACSAPRQDVRVESATLLSGPGKELPPGMAPFEPRLQATLILQGLQPGDAPEFRLWRALAPALEGLEQDRLIPQDTKGFLRLEGKVSPLGAAGRFQVITTVGRALHADERLLVEVLVKGRLVGRGSAPLLELNLPTALPPRDGQGRQP